MKKNLLRSLTITIAFVICNMTIPSLNAQNNSPYWSLQGNSNTVKTSFLGTTTASPLRLFTGNKLRMYIDSKGTVNIGNGSALTNGYQLYVKGVTSGIYASGTSYGIYGDGGSYGVYGNSV